MAYKRYIKRGGKLYGPYIYHSRKKEGRVTSEYRGKVSSDRNLIFLIIGLSLLFLLIFISTFSPASNINLFGLIVEDTQDICLENNCVKLFDVKIIDFKSPVKLGEFFDFTYSIKGTAEINNVEVQFWIEKEGEIISSGLDTIYLDSFEEKTLATKIFLPSNIESGVHTFVVQIDHENYSVRSERTIEISVGEGGIAKITEIKGLQIYAVIVLIILAIIILFLIFYLERKKIKAEIMKQESWIKKHKISVLAFTLFIVLGILFYSLNLFNILFSWIKTPSFSYALKIVLAVFVLSIAVFIARKINLFEKLKTLRIKRSVKISLPKIEHKVLTKKYVREKSRFKRLFSNFADVFAGSIKKIFGSFKRFLRAIKKESKPVVKESIKIERTFSEKFKEWRIKRRELRRLRERVRRVRAAHSRAEHKILAKRHLREREHSKKSTFNFIKAFSKKVFENLKRFLRIAKKKSKPVIKESSRLEKTFINRLAEKFGNWKTKRKKLRQSKEKQLPKHVISKETQKEIKETFSFKSPAPRKFRKFGLKFFELIQKFIGKSLKSIRNSIKSLEIFVSKKRKEIALEGREVARKTERTIEEIYEEIFYLLRNLFGKKPYADMIKDFKKTLVGKRKFTNKHLKILKSLEKNVRREIKQTKSYIHQNLDNLRNEAEILIKKLINYSRNLDKKEIEKIRKVASFSRGRSIRLINRVKRGLKNSSVVIHLYSRKMQISYLRGLHNIKKMFFKEKREIIDLIKELENRELVRMQGEEDEKVKKILEQNKETNKREIFKKKVVEDFLPFGSEIDTEIIPKKGPKKQAQSVKKTEDKSTKDIIENIADKEEEKSKKP